MTLTVDHNSNELTINVPDWGEIERALVQINSKTNCYLILTAHTGSYIQCAGSPQRLTIEYREFADNSFKHYVLGKGPEKSPLRTVWDMIDCRVGPINLNDCVVLSLVDALVEFRAFYENGEVSNEFKKRNVTRQYQE